jgi:hypothetical protein
MRIGPKLNWDCIEMILQGLRGSDSTIPLELTPDYHSDSSWSLIAQLIATPLQMMNLRLRYSC